MELTEDLCEDNKAWIRYEDDDGDICILRKCTECGRYIKEGTIKVNGVGNVKFEGFICSKHGEINPFYIRD